MFIMMDGSSKRCGSRYDYMLVPELSSYNADDGLYYFDNDEDGQAFFFLDTVDVPFPKPPDNDDDEGFLDTSTDLGVVILRIRCDPGGGPRDDNNTDADVDAVDR